MDRTLWPARAPDLTPLDYFFYANEIDNIDLLNQKIWEAVATISEEIIASVYKGFIKRHKVKNPSNSKSSY